VEVDKIFPELVESASRVELLKLLNLGAMVKRGDEYKFTQYIQYFNPDEELDEALRIMRKYLFQSRSADIWMKLCLGCPTDGHKLVVIRVMLETFAEPGHPLLFVPLAFLKTMSPEYVAKAFNIILSCRRVDYSYFMQTMNFVAPHQRLNMLEAFNAKNPVEDCVLHHVLARLESVHDANTFLVNNNYRCRDAILAYAGYVPFDLKSTTLTTSQLAESLDTEIAETHQGRRGCVVS